MQQFRQKLINFNINCNRLLTFKFYPITREALLLINFDYVATPLLHILKRNATNYIARPQLDWAFII